MHLEITKLDFDDSLKYGHERSPLGISKLSLNLLLELGAKIGSIWAGDMVFVSRNHGICA